MQHSGRSAGGGPHERRGRSAPPRRRSPSCEASEQGIACVTVAGDRGACSCAGLACRRRGGSGDTDVNADDAEGVDPAAYAATDRRGVRAGSLAALRGEAVAISAAHAGMYGWRLGGRVDGWLADGTRVRLRVVAILDDTLGAPELLLPLDRVLPHQAAPLADSVHVTVRDGAAPGQVAAALRARLAETGAAVTPTGAWLAAGEAQSQQANRFALLVMLGLATLYTLIAIANTMVMAASQRARDSATLRLAGTTVAQLMRMHVWETVMVLTVGVAFGVVAAAASVVGMWGALGRLTGRRPAGHPVGAAARDRVCCRRGRAAGQRAPGAADAAPAARRTRRHPRVT